jgi:hypothetical protein
MKFSYVISFAEYKAAIGLHLRHKVGRRIGFLIIYRVFPVLAVLFGALTVYGAITGQSELVEDWAPISGAFIGIGVVLPLVRSYQIRKSFRQMFPPGHVDRTMFIELDDENIRTVVPGVGEGKYFWTGISAVAHDNRTILIYVTETRFLLLPKRVLDKAQQSELDALISRHVETRKSC